MGRHRLVPVLLRRVLLLLRVLVLWWIGLLVGRLVPLPIVARIARPALIRHQAEELIALHRLGTVVRRRLGGLRNSVHLHMVTDIRGNPPQSGRVS